MTKKLFWNDSHLIEFTAQVIAVDAANKTLVLDQTAFYPTGGGQPHDTGRINGSLIRDVTIEGDRIYHSVDDAAKFTVGNEVKCLIDWQRRLEMMQQHTGQHILSQAFFQLFGAETRGFRISDKDGGTSEIDLALELQNDQIQAAISQAEDLANAIIFENREIRSFELSPGEAARLPLRKESFVSDCVRVVEIADFDWSPCGGTHAHRTGEVGLIAIRGWERAKKMVRVEFVAGVRALGDYRAANQTAQAVARLFSVGRDNAGQSVAKIIDDNKRLEKRVRDLGELAARIEAQEIITATPIINDLRIITRVFTDRSFDEIKMLAHRLVENESTVVLLAAQDSDAARLVFARAPDLQDEMGALMKAACEKLGGRGGGTSDFAQGGATLIKDLEVILAEISDRLQVRREA